MLKKRMSAVLSAIWLVCMVTSCGRHAMSNFESADTLAREIYHTAGLDMDGVYGEVLGEHSAYCAGMSEDEFRSLVESAVVYRKMIDSDGQTLYVFQMKSERASADFAKKYYESYEWAACDNAEKLVVACAGSWLICFKSSADEADAVLQSFKTLSGGTLFYDKAQINKG